MRDITTYKINMTYILGAIFLSHIAMTSLGALLFQSPLDIKPSIQKEAPAPESHLLISRQGLPLLVCIVALDLGAILPEGRVSLTS